MWLNTSKNVQVYCIKVVSCFLCAVFSQYILFSSCWLESAFYYAPRPLIDRAGPPGMTLSVLPDGVIKIVLDSHSKNAKYHTQYAKTIVFEEIVRNCVK